MRTICGTILARAAVAVFSLVAAMSFAATLLLLLPAAGGIVEDFRDPPAAARPWCYWYWVNGNVDRETARRDLAAIRRTGFGGILLLDPRGYDRVVR